MDYKVWLIILIAIPVLYFGFDFQAWIFTDFRRKIGDKKFFAWLFIYIFVVGFVVYILSK